MKYKAGELALWFYLSYLLYGPIRRIFKNREVDSLFEWLFDGEVFILIVSSLIPFFAYSLVTYTILFFTHRQRRFILAVILFIMLIPGVIFFRYLLQEVVQKAIFGFGNYSEGFPLYSYFLDNLYYGLFFPWVGGIFYFVQYSKYKDKQQKEQQIQNQKAQLSLLRSQVNPHFLFNALNNIYSLVYHQSDHSLVAVEKLSGLLRYSLYEQSEKVPLEKEVRYMQDFIELERMRYDYNVQAIFEQSTDLQGLKIAPFLLIPFVENAFKHGQLDQPEQPVQIQLYKEDACLVFATHNRIAQREKHAVGGVGLENIKQRLSLIYGEDYILDIEKKEDSFSVKLKINLAKC